MNSIGYDDQGVKQRYRYDEWPLIEVPGATVVRSFLPELAEHHALSLEGRDPHGPHGVGERYVDPSDPGVRVLVDIFTLPSVADARSALLRALTEISAPRLPSCAERGLSLGEVSFCGFGDPITTLLFVRRNVFVTVRSVGTTAVHVPDLAGTLDGQITARSGVSLASPRALDTGTQYDDLFSRDNFGDSGVVPSLGNPYQSPDIIPLQSGTLTWPQVQTSYNGPDIGRPIVNGGLNNIYVRAKNLNAAQPASGTVGLYYSKASVFLLPSTWTPVTGPSGQGALPLVDASASPSIAPGALALSSPAFLLTGLPPASNDHYCLISIIQTPTHPVAIPQSFPSNAAFAQWVQNNAAVAWRNLSVVGNGLTQIVRSFQFGSTNPGGAYFYFSFIGTGYPTGTGVNVQCTDVANPIQWSGSLPAPDNQGNQITGFQNWVIGGFSGSVVVTLTSPGGAFPSGARLSFKYYQVPTTLDALHRSVGRFVEVAQVHEQLGPQTFTAFLIPLGECTLVVP